MTYALITLLLTANAIPVELSGTDGRNLSGKLARIDSEALEIEIDTGPFVVPFESINTVRFGEQTAVDPADAVRITLTDGSLFPAKSVTSDGANLSITLTDGVLWTIPRSKVRSAQLIPLNNAGTKAWNEFQNQALAADTVVIKRGDEPLQTVEGIFGQLDSNALQFQFDGDWIDVKRPRIAGLIFYSSNNPNHAPTICQLELTNGGVLELASLGLANNRLEVTSTNGTKLSVPVAQTAQLSYASSSTVYLSDLEPQKWTFSSQLRIPALAELEERWLRPRKDRTISGGLLTVRNDNELKTFQKGLGIHSGTELIYRIAAEYRRFEAVIAMDEFVSSGRAIVTVFADGEERFRQAIAQDSAPIPVNVNLTGINRLVLRIDPADDADFGDHVNLCDARMIK